MSMKYIKSLHQGLKLAQEHGNPEFIEYFENLLALQEAPVPDVLFETPTLRVYRAPVQDEYIDELVVDIKVELIEGTFGRHSFTLDGQGRIKSARSAQRYHELVSAHQAP